MKVPAQTLWRSKSDSTTRGHRWLYLQKQQKLLAEAANSRWRQIWCLELLELLEQSKVRDSVTSYWPSSHYITASASLAKRLATTRCNFESSQTSFGAISGRLELRVLTNVSQWIGNIALLKVDLYKLRLCADDMILNVLRNNCCYHGCQYWD